MVSQKTVLECGPPPRPIHWNDNRIIAHDQACRLMQVIHEYVERIHLYQDDRQHNSKNESMQVGFVGRGMPGAKLFKRNRDGMRGGLTFEEVGCITSASEIGKAFGTISAPKIHARIDYLAQCGLIEYDTYKPKYKKVKLKERPYWYTKLVVTPKGLEYMKIYNKMVEMMLEKVCEIPVSCTF
jgi:hypothetical protein